MTTVDDLEKYKKYIDGEIERKKNIGLVNIFADFSIKFMDKAMLFQLKTYLESKYPSVEMKRCKMGSYDIIISW